MTLPEALAAETTSFRDIKMSPTRDLVAEARGDLRLDALEVADILRIAPMVQKLRDEKQGGAVDTAHLPKPLQQARLLCLWRICMASQEVRKAIAQIDSDLSLSYIAQERLTSRENTTINLINNFNFMQGGVLGTVKQSLGLHGVGAAPRQEIGITTFGLGTVLSIVDLLVPSFFNETIKTPPNSLSSILDRGYSPPDAAQSYLWQFLDATTPGTNLNRREMLVRHWHDFDGLNAQNAVYVRKISSNLKPEEALSESISTLAQRIDLLHDLKTHIEEFDGCLFELHQAISFN